MFVFINCHMCRDAPALGSTKRSYYTMFQEAVACTITDSTDILKQPAPAWPEFPFHQLDKRYTYLFELCHPKVPLLLLTSSPVPKDMLESSNEHWSLKSPLMHPDCNEPIASNGHGHAC